MSPLEDALADLRELHGHEIPPPDPAVLPAVVERIQQKLQTIPSEVAAALLNVAATKDGTNAAFVVRSPSGWDVTLWVGTESWENPTLQYGVSVQKVWTW
jgi:hypothetical protein